MDEQRKKAPSVVLWGGTTHMNQCSAESASVSCGAPPPIVNYRDGGSGRSLTPPPTVLRIYLNVILICPPSPDSCLWSTLSCAGAPCICSQTLWYDVMWESCHNIGDRCHSQEPGSPLNSTHFLWEMTKDANFDWIFFADEIDKNEASQGATCWHEERIVWKHHKKWIVKCPVNLENVSG